MIELPFLMREIIASFTCDSPKIDTTCTCSFLRHLDLLGRARFRQPIFE